MVEADYTDNAIIAEIVAFRSSCAEIAKTARIEAIHWLDSYHEQGDDFCYACACLEVEAINMRDASGAFVDGGWGGQEADGCRHCCKCGVMLDLCLTDYAVQEEIGHFLETKGPLTAEDAAHITAIFDAIGPLNGVLPEILADLHQLAKSYTPVDGSIGMEKP